LCSFDIVSVKLCLICLDGLLFIVLKLLRTFENYGGDVFLDRVDMLSERAQFSVELIFNLCFLEDRQIKNLLDMDTEGVGIWVNVMQRVYFVWVFLRHLGICFLLVGYLICENWS